MYKIGLLVGTRPDAIKMAPLAMVLKKTRVFSPFVIASAQHRELLDQVIHLFGLKVDVDFNLMKEDQDLFYITGSLLKKMKNILEKENLDLLLVQGDTTTSFVAALSAFYKKIPIGHIEAGLRTFDKYQPFPEEINRIFIDNISDLLFAPTDWAKENLIKSGIPIDKIYVTGNTGIDALFWVIKNTKPDKKIEELVENKKKVILFTCHRRESFGSPMEEIFEAVREIAKRKDTLIVYPVHPNPNVKEKAKRILGGVSNIKLIKPLSYENLAFLLSKAYLALTDSGGIQEEAPSFGVPVFVLRNKTERPEGIECGVAKLLGTNKHKILEEVTKILDNEEERKKMSKKKNPYGDGKASVRILKILKEFFG
ncbi:MAG: UDP-N-acetylglucosamine 2-epimerase (non-hydrolyzing) [candidate division WOR-3 bacterium]